MTLVATPALLLIADVIGRQLVPGELRVSIVSAFLGAPVLILLVRRQRAGGGRMMTPSRRLLASCALLLLGCLLIALFGLRNGAVTLDFSSRFSPR